MGLTLDTVLPERRKDAMKIGAKHYFTGNPCCRGHISIRYTEGSCMDCKRDDTAKWKALYPDKVREMSRLVMSQKRRTLFGYIASMESTKRWRDKNRDSYNAKRRVDECVKERRRLYQRKLYNENPEPLKLKSRLRRRYIKNVGGSHTVEDIKNLLVVQSGRCYWCCKPCSERYHVDHIVPLIRGGSNDLSNLAIACPLCNLQKNTKSGIEFAALLMGAS